MKTAYKIQSKTRLPDGTPEFLRYDTSHLPFDEVRKFHLHHLKVRTHTDKELMRYVKAHGPDSLEIIRIDKLPEKKKPVDQLLDEKRELGLQAWDKLNPEQKQKKARPKRKKS